jgi:hypothetical protein
MCVDRRGIVTDLAARFQRDRLGSRFGKQVAVSTAALTDSRGNDSVNTFPAQRLDQHVPVATTRSARLFRTAGVEV